MVRRMSEPDSTEVTNLMDFAASTRLEAHRIERVAIAEGVYDDQTKAHIARLREDADITDAVAAWGRNQGF